MSDIGQIVLTALATIIGGLIIYFFGHLSVAIFVEPIHRLRSFIGEIADSLIFYANVYCSPRVSTEDKKDEAKEVFRRQASQLMARLYAVSWYPLWEFLKVLRKKKDIKEASEVLMALSNSVQVGEEAENGRRQKRIQELLGITRDK